MDFYYEWKSIYILIDKKVVSPALSSSLADYCAKQTLVFLLKVSTGDFFNL